MNAAGAIAIPAEVGVDWAESAHELAAWTFGRLVNRRDAYGRYLPVAERRDDRSARTAKEQLTPEVLARHYRGESVGDLVGLHSTVRDEPAGPGEVAACWSLWLAVDIDRHDEETDPGATLGAALALWRRARDLGFLVLLLDSNGRGGYHLLLPFSAPAATAKVHALGKWLVRDWRDLGLDGEPEVFPKQPAIAAGGYGNWLRLPGRHHTRDHFTRVWDGSSWLEGRAAVDAILASAGSPAELIPAEALTPPSPPPRGPRKDPKPEDFGRDAGLAAMALKHLDPSMDYPEWLKVGMALTQLGREGLDLWDRWSSGSVAKYQEGLCDRKWRGFRKSGVALGTLFYMAKARGFEFPRPTEAEKDADAETSPAASRGGALDGDGGPPSHPDSPTGATAGVPGLHLTDLGNAERLVRRHGRDLRYCHPWKRWLVWDGRRWAIDNTGEARRRAFDTVRSIYGEAEVTEDAADRRATAKWAGESEKRERISAMITLAEAAATIPVLPESLDVDPWAFNCANGTIDLRTGELRPHRREDLLSKLCPVDYDPKARCDLWESTLDLFFAGDRGLIDYFQAICGYAIAGVVRDHLMPVAYGKGSNGKSTMLGSLLEVFGPDYAMKCPPDMLMANRGEIHPTERADLFGKRLVVAIESEGGRRLNETMVKELTGGDKIRARRMREDFWEFHPTHTLILATNHKPKIKNTDDGIWRRLRLLPFDVKVEGERRDLRMPEKLRAEYPGILAWCVRGCLRWQRDGLAEPARVVDASAGYRKEQDILGVFLDECVVFDDRLKIRAGDIFARYQRWCEESNERALSLTAFGESMTDRGVEKKPSNGTWYLGMQLRNAPGDRQEGAIP